MKGAEGMKTGFRLNGLVRGIQMATFSAALVWSAGASAADMCGGDANFSYSNTYGLVDTFGCTPFHYSGVTLNKTLTLLNDVDKIRGATYDPVRGEVVFVGEGTIPVDEQIDMDDLVVALQSVFLMQQDPGITFYTADTARAYQTGLWDVTYSGNVRNRQFGQTLFDADYLLKQLSLGIDPTGLLAADTAPTSGMIPS